MPPEDLRTALRQQPFVPFRLHLTDGRSFDVPHPEFLTLIGIAVKQGLLDVNKPAPVPEWRTLGHRNAWRFQQGRLRHVALKN